MVRGQLREWIYEWIYILKWRTGCHSHLRGRTDQNCAGVWGRTRTGEAEERDYDGPLAADLDSWIKGWGRHLLKWKISADFQETKREAMASFVNHIVWGHRGKTHIGQKNIRRIRGCQRDQERCEMLPCVVMGVLTGALWGRFCNHVYLTDEESSLPWFSNVLRVTQLAGAGVRTWSHPTPKSMLLIAVLQSHPKWMNDSRMGR